jgi:hypothetical protein
MANVLNRLTKIYLQSVNTPDYPVNDWIVNPDLSNVAGVPSRYWKIVGDTITEMSVEEKEELNEPDRVGTIAKYDPDDEIVPNRVIFLFASVRIHSFDGVSNTVEVVLLPNVANKYLKVEDGDVVEMTSDEKADVDAFVKTEKSRILIMSEVFQHFTSGSQAARMVSVVDTKASFLLALDAYNYTYARSILSQLLSEGKIIISDIVLCNTYIPSSLL